MFDLKCLAAKHNPDPVGLTPKDLRPLRVVVLQQNLGGHVGSPEKRFTPPRGRPRPDAPAQNSSRAPRRLAIATPRAKQSSPLQIPPGPIGIRSARAARIASCLSVKRTKSPADRPAPASTRAPNALQLIQVHRNHTPCALHSHLH